MKNNWAFMHKIQKCKKKHIRIFYFASKMLVRIIHKKKTRLSTLNTNFFRISRKRNCVFLDLNHRNLACLSSSVRVRVRNEWDHGKEKKEEKKRLAPVRKSLITHAGKTFEVSFTTCTKVQSTSSYNWQLTKKKREKEEHRSLSIYWVDIGDKLF